MTKQKTRIDPFYIFIIFCLATTFYACKTSQNSVKKSLGIYEAFSCTIDLNLLEGEYKRPLTYRHADIKKAVENNEDPLDYGMAWDINPAKNKMKISYDQKSNIVQYLISGKVLEFKIETQSGISQIIDESNQAMRIICLDKNYMRLLETLDDGVKNIQEYERI